MTTETAEPAAPAVQEPPATVTWWQDGEDPSWVEDVPAPAMIQSPIDDGDFEELAATWQGD